MNMNRRTFVNSALTAAALACSASPALTTMSASPRQRPFSWRDAENRAKVQGLAISSDGNRVALQVTRPLGAGGAFDGPTWLSLLDPRGDLWLLDHELENAEPLKALSGGAWSPWFSPDSKRLSALTMVSPGRVGLVVWELESRKCQIFSDANVEIFLSKFRTAEAAYCAPTTFYEFPRDYLWADETSILYVDHGPAPPQYFLAQAGLSSTLRALREHAQSGQPSVRLWSDRSPTCGAGARLVRIACDTGISETLYVGDVRGVSLSPDRQALAAVVATSNIMPVPNTRMQSPLLQTGPGDDSMVALKLVLMNLALPRGAHEVSDVSAVGNVAPSRLPVWSSDSSRVAIPVRTTYSDAPSTGDDAAWEVEFKSGQALKWPAVSALDAELLAALITTDGLNTKAVIDRRPRTVDPKDYTDGGQIRGGAWRCVPRQVMFWRAPALMLIGTTGTVTLPGSFVSVQPPVAGEFMARTSAVRMDGRTSIITSRAEGLRMEDIQTSSDWNFLGMRAHDAAAVYKDDADTGTFLMLASPGKRVRRSSLKFNTYFRHVLRPQRRMLTHRFPDGDRRSGLLQLPIDQRTGERHPVIIWAYPNSMPSLDDSYARANNDINGIYPVQYLLTKGFAFFQAPFPISGEKSSDPMRAAVEAVLPWLDVLERQPEIISGEYGFFGHSNAGYVALALEVLSRRFKAIVAWDTFPAIGFDELHTTSWNVALNCAANLVQSDREYYEDPRQPYVPQPAPPWKDPIKYIRNDPLFNLNSASTPLLLVEGELDSDPRDMESVYSILYGRGVPVELAYYWGEGHVFASPGNIHDTWMRTERFFKTYLRMR